MPLSLFTVLVRLHSVVVGFVVFFFTLLDLVKCIFVFDECKVSLGFECDLMILIKLFVDKFAHCVCVGVSVNCHMFCQQNLNLNYEKLT